MARYEYLSIKMDHTKRKMPKMLASDADVFRNYSSWMVASPYAFALPIMNRPTRTEPMFIVRISTNCLVSSSCSSEYFSI